MGLTMADNQKVAKVGVKKEKGYLYFIDKQGDISRARMERGVPDIEFRARKKRARVSKNKAIIEGIKVFVSYAKEDKRIAQKLVKLLSDGGVDIWFDEKELNPGDYWESKIKKAIRESHAVVLCLSQTAVKKRGFFQVEVRTALDTALKIPSDTAYLIPVRLDDCEVPENLREMQWVDFEGGRCVRKIMSQLRDIANKIELAKPDTETPGAPQP